MTKKKGDIHKDLRTPKYKMRVVEDKKKKGEKRRHKAGCRCFSCKPLERT